MTRSAIAYFSMEVELESTIPHRGRAEHAATRWEVRRVPDAPSVHEVHEHLAARRMHCIRRQVELRRDERETANDLLVRAIEGTIDWNDGIESASVTPTITERAMIIHGRARWVMRSTTITIGHNIWIG